MSGKRALVVLALLLTAVACDPSEKEWRTATVANSVAAYETFLSKHPDARRSAEARERIGALKQKAEIDAAMKSESAETLERVLARYPKDPAAPRLREQLETVYFNRAASTGSVEALQGYLLDHAASRHAAEVSARLNAIYDERLPEFRNARTVTIEVSESYGEARKTKLGFREEAQQILSHAGLRVVDRGGDVVLAIRASGEPDGANYSQFGVGYGNYLYTGVYFSGTLTFRSGESRVSESFQHDIEVPYSYTSFGGGGPHSPDEAPFAVAFDATVPLAMRRLVARVFGPGPLFSALTSGGDQSDTAKAIGRLKPPPVEKLIAILRTDPRSNVRSAVAKALGESRAPAAVRPLLEAVRADKAVHGDASVALQAIGKPAVPTLIAALADPNDSVVTCAIGALGGIENPDAVDALVIAAGSPTETVRLQAIMALGRIGGSRSVAALKALKAKGGSFAGQIDSALSVAQQPEPDEWEEEP